MGTANDGRSTRMQTAFAFPESTMRTMRPVTEKRPQPVESFPPDVPSPVRPQSLGDVFER